MSRVARPAGAAAAAAKPPIPQRADARLEDGEADDGIPGEFSHSVRPAEARVKKPAGVASSVFDAGRIAAKEARVPRGPKRPIRRIDPDAVVIHTDRPIPPPIAPGSQSGFDELLRRMPVGGSVQMPVADILALDRVARRIGYQTTRRVYPGDQAELWITARPAGAIRQGKGAK